MGRGDRVGPGRGLLRGITLSEAEKTRVQTIRTTYDARVTVPRPLKAVMSAEMLTPDGVPAGPARLRTLPRVVTSVSAP